MTSEDFKQTREKMRLTQTELAKRLEVTETTIYRWENGKGPIPRTAQLALKQIRTELRVEDLEN